MLKHICAYVRISGPVWLCLGLSGSLWACLALSGSVWLRLPRNTHLTLGATAMVPLRLLCFCRAALATPPRGGEAEQEIRSGAQNLPNRSQIVRFPMHSGWPPRTKPGSPWGARRGGPEGWCGYSLRLCCACAALATTPRGGEADNRAKRGSLPRAKRGSLCHVGGANESWSGVKLGADQGQRGSARGGEADLWGRTSR